MSSEKDGDNYHNDTEWKPTDTFWHIFCRLMYYENRTRFHCADLTTPSKTHCAAGFLGSSDTPVSCSNSWFTTSILVSASMRLCRLWRLSSGVSWNEWTWAEVMFRMWTTWEGKEGVSCPIKLSVNLNLLDPSPLPP